MGYRVKAAASSVAVMVMIGVVGFSNRHNVDGLQHVVSICSGNKIQDTLREFYIQSTIITSGK